MPAAIRYGLVIDTAVCREAPIALTLSGIGDLVAKFTAVRDWKLAFHACDEPVDTVLSSRDVMPEVEQLLQHDPQFSRRIV